jgi:hypothetical protein
MEERRAIPRKRTFLNGSVAFNNRNSTADCFVRDWSPAGAKIAIVEPSVAPREFDLVIPARGETRRAFLVWRQGDAAGVRFESPPTSSPKTSRAERPDDGSW